MSLTSTLDEWLVPSSRPALISTLINSVDRYNPNNVAILESYLLDQLKGTKDYDPLSNLAILKLYQFNPELSSPEVILNILLLTLANNPFSSDFALSLSLLSSVTPALAPLPPLSDLLQQRDFPAFWKSIQAEECSSIRGGYMEDIGGFERQVRENICGEIEGTFSRISHDRLARWLGLDDDDNQVDELAKERAWHKDGEFWVCPENQWNLITPGSAQGKREEVKLEQLQRLIHSAKK